MQLLEKEMLNANQIIKKIKEAGKSDQSKAKLQFNNNNNSSSSSKKATMYEQ